jgi:formylglycine-generating enzyme required for sulfatase activity/tetratricopeptide (TPR) repeat protein
MSDPVSPSVRDSEVTLADLPVHRAGASPEERRALLRADQQRRWRAGQPMRIEDYLAAAPDLADDAATLLDLIQHERQVRAELGETTSAAEYQARFPALAASLGPVGPEPQAVGAQPPTPSAVGVDSSSTTQQFGATPSPPAPQPPCGTLMTLGTVHTPDDLGPRAPEIPGYEVLGELGRGGMGVVYQARDRRLGRVVALKMIRSADHADRAELQRFLAEAQAVAALQHPHIVQVHDIGELNGLPFFTLEFVSGGSLAQRLGGEPQTASDAAYLTEQLARAMHYAHVKGVVHRDLKPANVLLDQGPPTPLGHCTAKITDFGLAKRVEGGSGMTRSGAILGTPSYMAPEQAQGKGKEVGPAADVYALGAVLYELLTGRPPFRAATAVDTLLQVTNADPVPPRRLQPSAPRDLETICLKCLEKNPERRYAAAGALADDLRCFLDGETITARPAGLPERAVKWVRRRPVVAGLLALILLLTFVGLTAVIWEYRQARFERDRAVQAETETRRERDHVGALLEQTQEANRRLIQAEIEQLATASPQSVPKILASLKIDPATVRPRLDELWTGSSGTRARQMRAGMALLQYEPDAVKQALAEWMLESESMREALLVRDLLKPHGVELAAGLWRKADDPATPAEARLRALAALAAYDPKSPHWREAGPRAAEHLLRSEHPVVLDLWTQAFLPVRDRLYDPLVEVFRGSRSADRKLNAAKVLAVHCADRPEALANLAADADAAQFTALQPALQKHRDQAAVFLKQELARTSAPNWRDPSLDSALPALSPEVVGELEAADGLATEHFAFCQTLPLSQAPALVETLRKSGYRPVQYRPYQAGATVQLAAVWTRDGAAFQTTEGAEAEALRRQDEAWRAKGFLPMDVASYLTADGVRHAALWVRKDGGTADAKLYVAVPETGHKAAWQPLQTNGYVPRTQSLLSADGETWHCAVWWKPVKPFDVNVYSYAYQANDYEKRFADGNLQTDVRLAPAPTRADAQQRYTMQRERADRILQDKPDDPQEHYRRGEAYFYLGEFEKAIEDLTAAIAKATNPKFNYGHRFRALAHATLGRRTDAQEDLAEFVRRGGSASLAPSLEALITAYLGDDITALKKLEEDLSAHPDDALRRYNAACVHARIAEYLNAGVVRSTAALGLLAGGEAPTRAVAALALAACPGRADRAERYAERALVLLREAFAQGFGGEHLLRSDADLDGLRDRPAFGQLLRAHPQYAAAWHESVDFESTELHGLDPASHLASCRRLQAMGYRLTGLSVEEVAAGQPLLAASVWRRPRVAEAERVALARRQASAAAALLHLGEQSAVWPLLRHTHTPNVRSFLVQNLAAYDVPASIVVKRLEEETDVSVRRALLLALGEYSSEQLSDETRAALLPRLLSWYRDDPDPGVHGAVDWLLRHGKEGPKPRKLDWNQAAAMKAIDQELSKQARGDRRWYVSKSGQTFTVFPGPVEFQMGSPSDEPTRHSSELLHPRRIPRSFALASKTVTVEQFHRFLSDVQQRYPGAISHTYLAKYSPDDDGPMIAMNWFDAAMYCRWLSEQEGMPEDQMCYPPIPEIRPGVKLPADHLTRTGYRLPTEAEWEYACRAGAATSRFYGDSDELLSGYAWYVKNSSDRAWPVGQLKPNDFGLFDVLGNAFERCYQLGARSTSGPGPVIDDAGVWTAPLAKDYSLLRGGAYSYIASAQRSAAGVSNLASARPNTDGLRLARTVP